MSVTLSPLLSPKFQSETFTAFDDARAIAPEWNDLAARLDGSLYSTPSWCEVWWRHYGTDRQLRVIAVRDGDDLVGVLPFAIERLPVFLGGARVAKLVGCDSTVALAEPAIDPSVAEDVFKLAIARLLGDDSVDMVHLGPCPESAQLDAMRSALAQTAGGRTVRDRQSASYTVFEMPEGFDSYLGSLSKNQRHSYRRNLNKLGNAFKFEVDVLRDGPALEAEFEAFVRMHQAQWNSVNKLGHFGDWPGALGFARDLVQTLSPAGQILLIRLVADGEVVAYHWCMTANTTCHSRLTARLNGKQWDQFAVGRIGQLKMTEIAAADGATVVEAGTGRYEYKEKLNGRTLPVHSIALRRTAPTSRVRARLALVWGDLLNLLYYRVWYLRVAPRIGILRRPLWRSWIRSRF